MKRILFFCLCIYLFHGFAQNPYLAFKWAIKLDNTIQYRDNKYQFSHNATVIDIGTKMSQYVNPMLTLVYCSIHQNQHRIGLGGTMRLDTSYQSLKSNLLYEYVYVFGKHKNWHWIPSLGGFVNPNTAFGKHEDSGINPTINDHTFTIGSTFGVCPRLAYYTKKSFFFELGIPVSLLSLSHYYRRMYVPNQIFSTDEVRNTYKWLPDGKGFNLQVSIGIKLPYSHH